MLEKNMAAVLSYGSINLQKTLDFQWINAKNVLTFK